MLILKKYNSLKSFLKDRVFLDKNEKKFINYNKKKWKNNNNKKNKGIILVDLFSWNPLIFFWSYITNLIASKKNYKIKYFYFDFDQNRMSKFKYYIKKAKKIFKSFNVTKGISEYDFNYSKQDLIKYKRNFKKIKSKRNLINYHKDGIKIGDLIYDTYLRIHYEPTLKLDDERLKTIFLRSEKIFEVVTNFFKKNKVKILIPSHVCYMSYGIIVRIASKLGVPVVKVKAENGSNAGFRLTLLDPKYNLDEPRYYNYKSKFKNFSKLEKKKAITIGKKIIKNRVSGKFDNNIPYIKKSTFRKSSLNKIKNIQNKPKIILFLHCFYDNPHRFRSMIFNDFYEQIYFILELSKKLKNYQFYFKSHPNEYKGFFDIHKKIAKEYKNITYIDQDVSHYEILKLKPKCIISNHGTVAHEYAYFNVPVLNTGDNAHINYDFCLHIKSKKELKETLLNLDKKIRKIKFDRNKIYEYLYMHYEYVRNINKENQLLNDSYFASKNINLNKSSEILKRYIKTSIKTDSKIKEYIHFFLNQNGI